MPGPALTFEEDFGVYASEASADEVDVLGQDEPQTAGLEEAIAYATQLVPPLWPLADFVAVNPFLGLADRKFLGARAELLSVRRCEALMPSDYYTRLLATGQIEKDDVEQGLRRCKQEYPQAFRGWNFARAHQVLWRDLDGPKDQEDERIETLSERLDRTSGERRSQAIVDAMSRFCGAHYDEGQASWPSPWKGLPLFSAWRSAAQVDLRMEASGIKGFRRFVSQLPETPEESIQFSLQRLRVPKQARRQVLSAALFSVAGWASFLKRRDADQSCSDLVGLLAIRLAYDAALAELAPEVTQLWRQELERIPFARLATKVPDSVLARYVFQSAAEAAFQRRLLRNLAPTSSVAARSTRALAQMVFCIDVRSETLRRQLEAVGEGAVETFGFAGFFGVACEHVRLGETAGTAQCPVLLKPAYIASETMGDEATEHRCVERRSLVRSSRKVWKSFQTSALSGFSFVESTGVAYAGKLLGDSLRWTRPAPSPARDGLGRCEAISLRLAMAGREPSLQERVDLAENILRNIGLTSNFARFVVLCGHGSETTNNPYKAGLDCGACGGHAGEPNARVAAGLLNDPEVRQELARRGLVVPDDTRFLAAFHETIADEIKFFSEGLTDESREAFEELKAITRKASASTRAERAPRSPENGAADALRRGLDWSEVRPEWGLAGNAAFIAARRSRTEGQSLGTRCFLHSYDYAKDREERTLELILSAPVVVASWINLQYYASTVDNLAFGSGDKTIHDVIGRIGVLSGNGGDLRTGLPWQSIHDGKQLQHEPLRLFVLVEAPREAIERILQKHPSVNHLVSNGWAHLGALEGDSVYLRTPDGEWEGRHDSESAAEASRSPLPSFVESLAQ